MFGQNDHLWQKIDDTDPPGFDLWRLPFRRESGCWRGTSNHHAQPIDFLVFDDRAWQLVEQDTLQQVTFDAADQDEGRRIPSDHCPVAVDLPLE